MDPETEGAEKLEKFFKKKTIEHEDRKESHPGEDGSERVEGKTEKDEEVHHVEEKVEEVHPGENGADHAEGKTEKDEEVHHVEEKVEKEKVHPGEDGAEHVEEKEEKGEKDAMEDEKEKDQGPAFRGKLPPVDSMEDYFDFFKQALGKNLDFASDDEESDSEPDPGLKRIGLDEMADRLDEFSLSTAYSGIGAPEATFNILCHYLEKAGGKKVVPHVLHQIEFDKSCQEELSLYGKAPPPWKFPDTCLFGDLNDFYKPSLSKVIAQLKKAPDMAMEVLAKSVASGEACQPFAYCVRHQKICSLSLCLCC